MIQHYRGMLDDPVRLSATRRAIFATVRPGDVFADIGCGLGTFCVFASQAGAGRILAVESSPILEVAREVVATNGCADRVSFLAGRSTEIDVPERAQVVWFEDYTTTLLSPAVVRVLQDLKSRWLAPGGRLLPAQARVWIAPVEDAHGYQAIDRFAATQDRVAGVDVTPSRSRVFRLPHTPRLEGGALLAQPSLVAEVDLAAVSAAAFQTGGRVKATRHGAVHGLLLWFELLLGDEWVGTGPLSPPTAWRQTLFPTDEPVSVGPGDDIDFELEAGPLGEDMVWVWAVGSGTRRFEASSLDGMPLSPAELAVSHAGFVPAAGPELDLDRAILNAVDGRRSVSQIAETVAALFRDRFTGGVDAEPRVASFLAARAASARDRSPSSSTAVTSAEQVTRDVS